MNPSNNRNLNLVAAIGLAIGGIGGIGGTLVAGADLRQLFWAVDGVAIVIAAALLTLKYFREGKDWIAAGFLVFAVGEGLILSANGADLTATVPAYSNGICLWAAALLLISIPREFALWIRVAGILAAVLFIVTAVQIFWGVPLLPTSSPLPYFAYPVFVLTFVGWIWTLVGKKD